MSRRMSRRSSIGTSLQPRRRSMHASLRLPKGPSVSARLSRVRGVSREEEGAEDEGQPQQEQEPPRRRSMAARLPSTKGSPSNSPEPSLARRMPTVVAEGGDNQLSSSDTLNSELSSDATASCPGDEAAHGTSPVLEQVQSLQADSSSAAGSPPTC